MRFVREIGLCVGSLMSCLPSKNARVAELVDALVLGTSGVTRESSSLSFRTILRHIKFNVRSYGLGVMNNFVTEMSCINELERPREH